MKKLINATITPDQIKKLRNLAKIAKNSCESRPYLQFIKFEKVIDFDCDGAFVEKLEISATDGFIFASIKVKASFENFDEPVYFHCNDFATINNDHDKKSDMDLTIESSLDAWSRSVKGQFDKPQKLKVGDPDSMPDFTRLLITPKPDFKFAISVKKLKQALECVQGDDKMQTVIIEGNTQDKRQIKILNKTGETTALICLLNL
tara:strand:- start:68 stop:679 length:612 start_codon:yes stop_codon:yes gene_type:complete